MVFFDDILVYSKDMGQNVMHLKLVFNLLKQHTLFVKLNKCSFVASAMEYLCHIISFEGVTTDPTKIQAIQEWTLPTTVKQLHVFLGLVGYYKGFIWNFA